MVLHLDCLICAPNIFVRHGICVESGDATMCERIQWLMLMVVFSLQVIYFRVGVVLFVLICWQVDDYHSRRHNMGLQFILQLHQCI